MVTTRSSAPLRAFLLALLAHAGCSGAPAPTDQRLLAPPAPGQGTQVVIGPFSVPQGHEVQLCQTFKLDNDDAFALHEIEARHSLGSHHLILFRSVGNLPVDDQTFDCWGVVNWDQWSFVADVQQREDLTWTLPDGHAFVLDPHQQMMVQAHYVNATTVQTPEQALAFMNLYRVPVADVRYKVGSMFTVNTNVLIPPHSQFTNHRNCIFSTEVRLVGMTGHFHARGLEFDVDELDYSGRTQKRLYQSLDWNNPPFQAWDPTVFEQRGIQFSCTYFNDTDQTITWGSHADVQEHCNLFFHYTTLYPGDEPQLRCTNGSGGW